MDLNRLKAQLAIDEGRRLQVYRDTVGYLTVGIGHKLLADSKLKKGDWITPAVCDAFFEADVRAAVVGCLHLLPAFNTYPEAIQESLVNMTFNLGVAGLGSFHQFLSLIQAHKWQEAATDLEQTKWYTQVGDRGKRIVARIRQQGV